MWQAGIMRCPASIAHHADNYASVLSVFSCLVEHTGDDAMHIMVRDKRTGAEEWITLEQAAELLGLPADEIEAALEEFGECECRNWIALDQDW
jgi:hypothetical protein